MKEGLGTLLISGNNDYAGPTVVKAGSLNVNRTVALEVLQYLYGSNTVSTPQPRSRPQQTMEPTTGANQ